MEKLLMLNRKEKEPDRMTEFAWTKAAKSVL